MIRNKVINNASWMIGCRILQMFINLWVVKATSKYLGPDNYGLIHYAQSLVAFAVPIMQLGLDSILVRELIDKPEKNGKILGTAIAMSFLSSFLCIAGISIFVLLLNGNEKETITVCILYSLVLIFQSLQQTASWFHSKYLSKYPSIVMVIAFIGVSIYKIFLLATKKSIYWFVFSETLSCIIISVILFIIYKKLGGQPFSISWSTAKDLFSRSRYYIVSSLMVTIFAHTDQVMIKNMLTNADAGYYSTVISCAGLSGFIFSSIIESARPQILESKYIDQKQFETNVSRLYSIIIYFSLAQSIVITLFAKYIIQILYSPEYYPAIGALRIFIWYTTFSYLGGIRNIWILAENKQKYLWIINLSGALSNIILNYILIPIMGINGAALASLVTQIFTNVIVNQLIRPIRHNNILMLRGLSPLLLIDMTKSVVKSIIPRKNEENSNL